MTGLYRHQDYDPIAERLAGLDRELAPANPLEIIRQQIPLGPAAAGLMTGICFQNFLELPALFFLSLCGILFIFFLFKRIFERHIPLLFPILLVFFCSFSLGCIHLGVFKCVRSDDIRHLVSTESQLATIRGTVESSIRIEDRNQWAFGQLQFTEPSSTFIFSVHYAKTSAGWKPASGKVYIRVLEPIEDLGPGDFIELHCKVSSPTGPTNPGMFDFRRHLKTQGIYLTASVPGRESIESLAVKKAGLFAVFEQKVRQIANDSLLSYGGEQERFSPLPEALLLGNRSRISPEIYHAFRKTGLAHYLSLSGMHVWILAGFFWWMTKTAGLEKHMRAVVCIILIGLFALAVPHRAPTMRAVFIAEFFFVSALFKQHVSPLNTLALAALVSLLIRPLSLFTAGWKLSYMTVFCILIFYRSLQKRFLKGLYALPVILNSEDPGWLRRGLWTMLMKSCDLLAVGLSAWIGGAGLILYHFGQISPLAFAWTLLCFPLVTGILLIGFLKIVCGAIFPTFAAIATVILNILSGLFIETVEFFAAIDFSTVTIGAMSIWLIVFYYSGLFGIPLLIRKRVKHRTFCTVLALLLLAGTLGWTKWTQVYDHDLKVTVLSVGHGLATVIQTPDNGILLFDTGSISNSNPGGRIVVPFLQHQGIEHVDAILLSHGDLDHYNGIPEIVSIMKPKTVYANSTVLERAEKSAAARKLLHLIEASGTEIVPCSKFVYEQENLTIRNIWPDSQSASDRTLSSNDRSEVVLLEYADQKILLCGDLEEAAQEKICSLYPGLRTDVLVLPHHGSVNGLLTKFVEMLDPEMIIASCSARRQASAYCTESAQMFYTSEHGAVTVTIKADGTLDAIGFLESE